MSIINNLIISVFLVCLSTAHAAPSHPLAGTYGNLSPKGEVYPIARVFLRGQHLYVQFRGGCTAQMQDSRGVLKGSCTIGHGYEQVFYQAKLGYLNRYGVMVPVLEWCTREYGDSENGFDAIHVTYQVK